MTTISQVYDILQRVFGPRADELARETQFVKRQSPLTGAGFVSALVFGYLKAPNAPAEKILTMLERCNTPQITESGWCQRFTPEAALFLERILQELVSEQVQAEHPAPVKLFRHFDAVVLEDSSTITLPDSLRNIWIGHGGSNNQSRAGLKIHMRWDIKHGGLQGPMLTGSRLADQRSPLHQQGIPAGTLNVADQGYCSLPWLSRQEGYYVTRPRAGMCFYDPQSHQKLDLDQLGPTQENGTWQGWVEAGSRARQTLRLILVRVPDDIVEQRRARIRAEAKRRGGSINEEVMRRAQWTILITNVAEDLLTLEEVVVLQRARWQIERLFRVWKEDGKVDEWSGRRPWRILCEIMAKLIAMLIEHWLVVLGTWQEPYRSLVKAARVVREYAPELVAALMGREDWEEVMGRIFKAMQKCRIHRRTSHPSHPQLLLEGLDWCLT